VSLPDLQPHANASTCSMSFKRLLRLPRTTEPHPSAPALHPSACGLEAIAYLCRPLAANYPTAMLETALFVSYSTIPVLLYQQNTCFGCSVTLGIRLSFHVHDHSCTRATCTLHKPAAPFSLCIQLSAAVHGRLLTCRSRNAAPATASAAQ
jgi:hypothetical protein